MKSRSLPWHAVIVVGLVGWLAAQASATVIDTLTDWNNVNNVNSTLLLLMFAAADWCLRRDGMHKKSQQLINA